MRRVIELDWDKIWSSVKCEMGAMIESDDLVEFTEGDDLCSDVKYAIQRAVDDDLRDGE